MAKVCIFFADGLEEIEGLTVVDLLRRAGIDIHIVSISDSLKVMGAHHIEITADTTFAVSYTHLITIQARLFSTYISI